MAGIKIKWLSHAGFQITSAKGKVILTDPFLEGNPLAPCTANDIAAADLVLVSHDHFDHSADAARIARKTGAVLVAIPETAARLKAEAGLPESQVAFGSGMNIGGTYRQDGISVIMTEAHHSSQTGSPAGYIIRLENGFTIYHAGDTGIFASMRILGELYPLDLALLPIGGVYTMDPQQAAAAVKLLRPRKAVPMHYKTFPILVQDAAPFVAAVREAAPETEVVVLEPGEEREF
jgi:L-ascorbate metabolism protein UlaG (beta-lactamase superfamily)